MQSVTGQVLEVLTEAARRRDELAIKLAPKLAELSTRFEPVATRALLQLADVAVAIHPFVIRLADGLYAALVSSPDGVPAPRPVSRYALRYKGTQPNWPMVSALMSWMIEHVRLTGYEKKEPLQLLAKEAFGEVRIIDFEEAYTRAFRRGRGRPRLPRQ